MLSHDVYHVTKTKAEHYAKSHCKIINLKLKLWCLSSKKILQLTLN